MYLLLFILLFIISILLIAILANKIGESISSYLDKKFLDIDE
jgi:hypothetical protein